MAEETVAVAAAAAERASVHSVEEAELGRGEAEAVVVGIVDSLLAQVGALMATEVKVAVERWEEAATDAVEMAVVRLAAVWKEAVVMVAERLAEVVGEVEALGVVEMVVEAGVQVAGVEVATDEVARAEA